MEWIVANIVPFIVVLSILVFVHEYGHYIVARWNKVGVEAFSIGFGPELFGWNDKHGTRWKVSLLPLGGFVKMYGDMDPASMGRIDDDLTQEQRARAFHHKSLPARSAIVFAGPAANFLFAIVAFAFLFAVVGEQRPLPTVGSVAAGSAAEQAGLSTGDRITAIAGQEVSYFEDLRVIVQANPGNSLEVRLLRDDVPMSLTVIPVPVTLPDADGRPVTVGRLGISSGAAQSIRVNPVFAVWRGVEMTYDVLARTLGALGGMITGTRDSSELGGPIRIAQMSADVAEGGLAPLINFMAFLSISLGLINLFPIPILDGGHLVFYALEAVRGKPLGPRAQEYGFRVGAVLVFSLLIFATWNDISSFGWW